MRVAPRAEESVEVRWFRVMEAADVPSAGAKARLPRGKVISSKNYDVDALLVAGVKMEPIEEPMWHKRLQERDGATAQTA